MLEKFLNLYLRLIIFLALLMSKTGWNSATSNRLPPTHMLASMLIFYRGENDAWQYFRQTIYCHDFW